MKKWLFYSFDLTMFALAPFIALIIRENFIPDLSRMWNITPYAVVSLVFAAIVLVVTGTHKGLWRHTSLPELIRLVVSITIVVVLTTILMFTITRLDGVPRSLPLVQWGVLVMILSAARVSLIIFTGNERANVSSEHISDKEHVLVVGTTKVAELYLRCVRDLASHKISVEAVLDENKSLQGRIFHGCLIAGHPQDLSKVLAKFNVHGVLIKRVVLAMPLSQLSVESRQMLLHWERTGSIKLEMFEEKLGFGYSDNSKEPSEPSSQMNMVAADSIDKTMPCCFNKPFLNYATVKRMGDFFGAALLLVVLSPFIALTSLLVAIDVGLPLYFWQLRPGCQGRPFRLYKFRTMKAGHDETGKRIADEQRQTAIGRFLRRTRMDELLQLYHILTGEMSFVGPRPLLPVDLPKGRDDLIKIRNSIRPGLTGWAQVNGGKEVNKLDKVMLDAWYHKNMSFSLDIQVLLKTVVMVIKGEKLDQKAIEQAYQGVERFQVMSLVRKTASSATKIISSHQSAPSDIRRVS